MRSSRTEGREIDTSDVSSPHAPPAVAGGSVQVVATAGHVDHGKSSLILRLTGIDPDRWAEEKRRGMTIDLGFAWATLPSGREVGFVDVPGHERFIRNMLAGVGPVRLVLFVVAADEGWKPQSEEHLQILDILGASGAVVALTKADLVEHEKIRERTRQIHEKLAGTGLEGAPIVACSTETGYGIGQVTQALEEMLRSAPPPVDSHRPRQFIDRVFTIQGAGTVVTGTLTGGSLSVGQEAEVLPSGHRARIRALQTHKQSLPVASPVSRVAVNLAGTAKTDLERGDVLGLPGQWRPTSLMEGSIRTVRTLDHALTSRGAYKLYAGSAERDARVSLYEKTELRSGEHAFVRVSLSRPVVLDVGESFVLREAGRRRTVAGGHVLDVDPPPRPGPDPAARLRPRVGADRATLAAQLISDRGAVRASDALILTGVGADDLRRVGAVRQGPWLLSPDLLQRVSAQLLEALRVHHTQHPLRGGVDIGEVRALLSAFAEALSDPALADAVLLHLTEHGVIARDGTLVRLPEHGVSTAGREEAERLVATVAAAEPTPPSVRDLASAGFGADLIRAVCAEGRLVRISPELVMTPAFVARAETLVRSSAPHSGLTVSTFREALGTSRKYALPLLEYFDARGLTRRQGDVRVLRR